MQLTSEDIFPLAIIALCILFIIAVSIAMYRKKRKIERWHRLVQESGFLTPVYVMDDYTKWCIVFDRELYRFMLIKDGKETVYDSSQLPFCRLVVNEEKVTEDRTLSDSLKGYMIAGKTGATIYGIRSKPRKRTIINYIVLQLVLTDKNLNLDSATGVNIPILTGETSGKAFDPETFSGRAEARVKDKLLRKILDQLEYWGVNVYIESKSEEGGYDPLPPDYHLPGAEEEY